jgi:uncharacterized protein
MKIKNNFFKPYFIIYNMHKLDKSVQITLIIVGTIILLTIAGIILFKSSSAENTISVSGQATSKIAPNLIAVYFNIETSGKTSKEASDANTVISNLLTSNIEALGFSKDELKTQSFNIYPTYDYSKNSATIVGYRASNSLKIELSIDKKDKVGSVIDAATNAGAGISYITFELTPTLQQQAKAEAIKIAAEDARVKAEALAKGFDKNLGRLVSVSLDNFDYYPRSIYTSAGMGVSGNEDAKEASVSINPSEQDVSAYVTAIYKLI